MQIKYRKAAHMKIASAAGVLGEKVKQDSTFNSLVNNQGNNSDSNILARVGWGVWVSQ